MNAQHNVSRRARFSDQNSQTLSKWSLLVALTALWAFGWLPNVANMAVRGRVSVIQSAAAIQDSKAAVFCIGAIYLILVGGAVLSVLASSRIRRPRSLPALLLLLAPSAIELLVSNPINGLSFLPRPQFLVFALLALALWLHGADRAFISLLAWLGIFTASASILMAVAGVGTLDLELGVVTDKALLFPDLLAGPYSYNNLLGLALVMCVPALLTVRHWTAAAIGFVLITVAILWTSSRTAVIALVAGAVVMALSYLITSTKLRKWLASILLLGLAAAPVAVALVGKNHANSFSERGFLWSTILADVSDSPWFGLGRGYFEPESPLVGEIGHYVSHGHNFFITVLATTGWVGVVAVAALLGYLFLVCVSWLPRTPVPLILVAVMMATATLETPSGAFPFERPNTTSFAIWIILAVVLWHRDRGSFREAFVPANWALRLAYRDADMSPVGNLDLPDRDGSASTPSPLKWLFGHPVGVMG